MAETRPNAVRRIARTHSADSDGGACIDLEEMEVLMRISQTPVPRADGYDDEDCLRQVS